MSKECHKTPEAYANALVCGGWLCPLLCCLLPGCILADDMGLGKTLQGITLMWTLLQQGSPALGGKPIAKVERTAQLACCRLG